MSRGDLSKVLPPRDFTNNPFSAYGDLKILSKHMGIWPVMHYQTGELPHAWAGTERNVHPDFVVGTDGNSVSRKDKKYFVCRNDQADYLFKNGFKDVTVIGHPITYLKKKDFRRNSSVIVMPPRSINFHHEKIKKFIEDYLTFLRKNIKHFNLKCLCVHPDDKASQVWSSFYDFFDCVVFGALEKDHNSYHRLQRLFSFFEFMTTPIFGSHVPYASYFGCKVSVCGPTLDFNKDHFIEMPLYKNQPLILDKLKTWHSTRYMFRIYSEFDCLPIEARSQEVWARNQLGADNTLEPKLLREALAVSSISFERKVKNYILCKFNLI